MQALLDEIRSGFDTLTLPQELKQLALDQLERWLSEPRFARYLPYIQHLAEQRQYWLLQDSFYKMIPFGTGGRRGAVGVGPNRFNPYTLSTSVQGHVDYLRERFQDQSELSVVIAYDVRHFYDLRRQFEGVSGPLQDLTSRELAWQAAEVYAANGVRVHILPADSDSYLSTPELSFLIRELKADGGLNVSASHNHPDDNGGKFYNQLGGQEIPPNDEEMVDCVRRVDDARQLDRAEALRQGLILPIGPEVRQRYIAVNCALAPQPRSRSAHVVFTPLHGTGSTTVQVVLQQAGFQVDAVADQSSFDGAFPNVPHSIANPELPESMDQARAQADELGADLVLSTDPDADRLGLAARDPHDAWRIFNGNEITCLLLQALLERRGTAAGGFVVTTWVTTSLLRAQAAAAGLGCVPTLAVGFKFIAEVLRAIEEEGSYHELGWGRRLEGELDQFWLGAEESHGYLVTPAIRDKDAAGAALLLAELASTRKDQGRTLADVLDAIHSEHGVVVNRLVSCVMQGAVGLQRIRAIQASLRQQPPAMIGGKAVKEVVDWHDRARFGPFLSETDEVTRDVLCFLLEDGSRLTIRASGTEPKNKAYVEVKGQPLGADASSQYLAQERRRLERSAQALADDFVIQALARVDIALPQAALRVSDLLPLEDRIWAVRELAPQLVQRHQQGASQEAIAAWMDEQLGRLGRDARSLVAGGLSAVFEQAGVVEELEDLLI